MGMLKLKKGLNLLMPGSNKRSYVLKQTYSYKLLVLVSTYDILLPSVIKGLKCFCLGLRIPMMRNIFL